MKKHEREKHGIDNAKFIRKDREVKIECSKCSQQFQSTHALNEHIVICIGRDLYRYGRNTTPNWKLHLMWQT